MNAALNHLVSVLATCGTHLGDLCFWSLSDASILRSDLESKWKSAGLPVQLLPEPPTVEKAFKLAVRETQVGLSDRLIRPVIDNEASVIFAVVHEQKHYDPRWSPQIRPLAVTSKPANDSEAGQVHSAASGSVCI